MIEKNLIHYLKCLSMGAVATVVVVAIFFLCNSNNSVFAELLFYEAIPFYNTSDDLSALFSVRPDAYKANGNVEDIEELPPVVEIPNSKKPIDVKIFTGDLSDAGAASESDDGINIEKIFREYSYDEIVGLGDISLEEAAQEVSVISTDEKLISDAEVEKLRDIEYLRSQYYTVDPLTQMTYEDFDIDYFVNADLSIDISGQEPKVLIVHTHSQEHFVGSDPDNIYDGVVGLGGRLAEILYDKYGIISVHNTTSYDMVNGKSETLGVYERLEVDVEMLLEKYPSIEIVLDIHRDGVLNESIKFVTEIDGKPTAQLMFFNGLSRLLKNGKAEPISYLPNPYLKDNLAMSFNMQISANKLYPGLMRKIYLRAYRFSLHQKAKSMLIEVGAQNNTKEEAFNAMEPLADILANVVLK